MQLLPPVERLPREELLEHPRLEVPVLVMAWERVPLAAGPEPELALLLALVSVPAAVVPPQKLRLVRLPIRKTLINTKCIYYPAVKTFEIL